MVALAMKSQIKSMIFLRAKFMQSWQINDSFFSSVKHHHIKKKGNS